ncbi:lipase member M-like [Ixodes scapularis]
MDPDSTRNVSELISSKGYPVEEYEATTSDGYVIRIQRIPRGKNESQDAPLSNKTTILLQHGVLGASSDFVINFPNQSLGFILADAGYDVWLGNSRGNTYSSHINLTREERQFWDFSIDETASDDLPSIIDTVLRETGKEKLQYVGWSQGALQMLALLSEKPEYNKKISLFSAMGPVAYLGNVRAPARLLVPFADIIANLWKLAGKGQFLVPSSALQNIATNLCGRKFGDEICTAILFLLAGVDSHQTNRSRLNVYFSHDPAGTSVNDFLQFAQAPLPEDTATVLEAPDAEPPSREDPDAVRPVFDSEPAPLVVPAVPAAE